MCMALMSMQIFVRYVAKILQHGVLYNWLLNFLPFVLGGALKSADEEDDSGSNLMNYWITTAFVEQPLAMPRSAKKNYGAFWSRLEISYI